MSLTLARNSPQMSGPHTIDDLIVKLRETIDEKDISGPE
jgi:hypothetical protein